MERIKEFCVYIKCVTINMRHDSTHNIKIFFVYITWIVNAFHKLLATTTSTTTTINWLKVTEITFYHKPVSSYA